MKTSPVKAFVCAVCVASGLICHPLSADQWVQVDRVFDGDTIRLTDGRIVRYLGIDAPEIDHDQGTEEPCGHAAKAANETLVIHQKIRLETADYGHDRYGRILARVFLADGRSVEQLLVERGLAMVLRTPSTAAIEAELIEAQRAALRQKIGLWQTLADIKGPFIGNRNSWRFHLQTCPYGKKTHQHNRVVLKDLGQAYWEGYAPCSHCFPSLSREHQSQK